MRLGISSSLKHDTPKEWAKKMVQMECRSVVFPVNCNSSEEMISAYAAAAKENDLHIAEVGVWENAISLSEQERTRAMEYSIGQLKLADKIGAGCCVNIIGSIGERWDGGYAENFSKETWRRAVKMIQDVIDEAKPKNTYFTIEPMPWMYPSGPEEYLQLMEDVNRERFAVHMDVINMINSPERYFFPEKFVEHCFKLLGDKIKSCHLKDVFLKQEFTFQLQECACGAGTFCLERYAQLALEVNPNMPMIIEHLKSDEDYFNSMAYVKKRLKNYLIRQ